MGRKLRIGDSVRIAPAYGGGIGVVIEIAPSGKFADIKTMEGIQSFHISDLTLIDYDEFEDW